MSNSVWPHRRQPTIPGILQARTLEWVAMSFSNAWKWKVKGKSLSRAYNVSKPNREISLVIRQLRLCAPNAGGSLEARHLQFGILARQHWGFLTYEFRLSNWRVRSISPVSCFFGSFRTTAASLVENQVTWLTCI